MTLQVRLRLCRFNLTGGTMLVQRGFAHRNLPVTTVLVGVRRRRQALCRSVRDRRLPNGVSDNRVAAFHPVVLALTTIHCFGAVCMRHKVPCQGITSNRVSKDYG